MWKEHNHFNEPGQNFRRAFCRAEQLSALKIFDYCTFTKSAGNNDLKYCNVYLCN